MKSIIAAAAMSLVISDFANAEETRGKAMMKIEPSAIPEADIRSVSPALARFGREAITEDLWTRDALSPRDRSMVTVAITHLAFYSGWPNAMSAISVTKAVFETRGVTADALPEASPDLLPLNQEAEKQRSETVEKNVGPISPGLVKFTADPLFLDLWQRPALKPRDRSLITVSALIASGQSALIGYHLNRAMDNGLSAEEAGEIVTQAAFYAGWPNAFTAAPVVGEVLSNRSSSKR